MGVGRSVATAVAGSAVRYGKGVEPEPADSPAIPQRIRLIYFALAWLFFAFGVLGILLPVLPGTVFMILALWAFSRSSTRFHTWLFSHRWFGPPLQKWAAHHVVPWSARVVAYASMLGSVIVTGLVLELHPVVPIATAVISIAAIVYISRCPSRIPDDG
jgi:hypothetical protein